MIFALIGSPKLSPRRRQIQHEMNTRIVRAIDKADDDPADASLLAPAVTAIAQPHAALAELLGGMPPFAGNTVELLDSYDTIIERMAQEIDSAQRYVYVEFYIIALDRTTERFFAAMERAVARGVKVRLPLDQIGSRSYPGRKAMERCLIGMNVDWHYMLSVGNPKEWLRLDLRNHRKILVVDGEVGYTGSLNVIDRTYHNKGDLQYDELCVRVTGPVVAQFAAIFATDWYSETGELLHPEAYPELTHQGWRATGSSLCQVLPSGPGFEDENNLRLFTGLIHAAKRRLIVVNPYFVPEDALMLAITSAALRGVKFTLINSETSDQLFVSSAQRSYYDQL
jgi:cardiolipin synthase A/B